MTILAAMVVDASEEPLLRQSNPAHYGGVAGIGTDRVKRGKTDAQDQFNFLVESAFSRWSSAFATNFLSSVSSALYTTPMPPPPSFSTMR